MDRKILERVARNIRAKRKQLGLSQEAFSELCGLHRTYIGMLERAEKNVTLLSLQKIANAFRVDVRDLLDEK